MKYLPLLSLIVVLFAACSKEDGYGPRNLKNGQELELLVDHRYGSINQTLLLLPEKQDAEMSLHSFSEREPGYTYKVKARMVVEKNPPQDGSAYYLEFLKVLSKERYEGNEPFDIALLQAPIPGGPTIVLRKEAERYYFLNDKIELTSSSAQVRDQLEEILQHADYLRQSWQKPGSQAELKWRTITATVTHDPEKFGKAYRVQSIKFVNK
ncbi:hypothetical protein [Arcticibacter sp. MXS-1]|uniref:hypothetical protein n=1 Tax=Arcticibacter sp. MXS-1 TaxID=3341726 RepID=UPI0035A8E34D